MPIHGGASPGFVFSLSSMIDWTHRANLVENGKTVKPKIDPIITSSSNVAASRCDLAKLALERGADWLLWLDSDHTFPANTLARLLARGRSVVGANYRRRMADEVKPTASALRDGKL